MDANVQPDIKAIKKRIEDLITRDYLERDKENPNVFRYLAWLLLLPVQRCKAGAVDGLITVGGGVGALAWTCELWCLGKE